MLRRCCGVLALAALAGCAGSSYRADLGREEEHESTGGAEAAAMRWQQRTWPTGKFPENGIWKAKLRRDEMARGQTGGGEDGTWTWIGPGNIGGRLRSMCIHPTTPGTMWVGAATGGVWKTTNGGTTWFPLPDFVPSLSIGCMVLSPSDPNTLYVGTGEGCFDTPAGSSNTAAVPGAGIFKSTDGGQTWAQIASTANINFEYVNRLAFQPGSSTVMLAATNSGIWRSTDAGETWSQRTTGQTLDVEFDPAAGSKALAGRNDGLGQYSLDGGVTWQNATGIAAGSTRVELTYAPSNTAIVYAAVSNGATMKVYQSVNGGQAYTLKTTSPANGVSTLDSYTGVLWVDPLNPNTLLLGTQSMYRSTNAGATLSTTFGNVHADHHYILQHPQYNGTTNKTLYFCGDGGIYSTADSAGSTSASLNNNMGVTQFYGAAISDATGVVLGGAQDNFTLRYNGNAQAWVSVIGGDGGFCAGDPTDSNFFYGGYQRFGLHRTSNGGASFTLINSGLGDAGTLNCNFIPFFMLDPNNPARMLAGGRSLWRTNNVKTGTPPTWASIKAPIVLFAPEPPTPKIPTDHFSPNDPRNISTIAVAQGNSDVVWVGHNNGQVFRTGNGTAATPTWTRVDRGAPGLPARWISQIVIDPANHSRVYVSAMGYAPDNVWKTEDNGATWQSISGVGAGALPVVAVSALTLHRQPGGGLLAGTDVGIFQTVNGGATWIPAAPELGPVEIAQLIWRNNTTLMAVTHGRGAYLGQVPVPPACYANCDGSTIVPILNVNDFICFQTKFAAGDPWANCDGSTIPPVLNVNDFICFQSAYAAGCP